MSSTVRFVKHVVVLFMEIWSKIAVMRSGSKISVRPVSNIAKVPQKAARAELLRQYLNAALGPSWTAEAAKLADQRRGVVRIDVSESDLGRRYRVFTAASSKAARIGQVRVSSEVTVSREGHLIGFRNVWLGDLPLLLSAIEKDYVPTSDAEDVVKRVYEVPTEGFTSSDDHEQKEATA